MLSSNNNILIKVGGKYYSFMTKELPDYITRIFHASRKREDTYIAGLSMGGYGAWFLALRQNFRRL